MFNSAYQHVMPVPLSLGAFMSHYYFHIRTGGILIRDEEGMECRNLLAAVTEAESSARDAARAALRHLNIEPSYIEIEDDDGNALGTITFAPTRH